MMHVVMVAAEAAPYVKVGGLADVLGALPQQLDRLGASVDVIIPRYRIINLRQFSFARLPLPEGLNFDVQISIIPGTQVRVFLLGNDRFFDRDGVYVDSTTGMDYDDQADRWIYFQRTALEFIRTVLHPVDVIHCHDFQTALIPGYLRRLYAGEPRYSQTKSVLTIHNIGYQGIFAPETMFRTGFDAGEFQPTSPFEFFGKLNFLKAGISFADLVTTVSPTYAREIQEDNELSFGLAGVLRGRPNPVIGILNGIDYDVWSPSQDVWIRATYDERTASDARCQNKMAVLHKFQLDESRLSKPLLAMVSRIDAQKGFDLVEAVLDEILSEDVSFVLLGTGNRDGETRMSHIAARYPDQVGLWLGYDEGLSHQVISGSDIFLMPSKYEPCGLTQMYSMRYGTVPVVRSTGGLKDTVQEFDPHSGQGTGFTFSEFEASDFKDAIDRALSVFADKAAWKTLMENGMRSDFSWTHSAAQYRSVYQKTLIGSEIHKSTSEFGIS
jgi:starch synthase